MTLPNGKVLGPYEIVGPLGAGGMGEVYKARDTRLDRVVAIKVLPSHLSDNADLHTRFEREAKATRGVGRQYEGRSRAGLAFAAEEVGLTLTVDVGYGLK
jgi:serine/threonine protein kinase